MDSSLLRNKQLERLYEATSAFAVRDAFRSDAQDFDGSGISDTESVGAQFLYTYLQAIEQEQLSDCDFELSDEESDSGFWEDVEESHGNKQPKRESANSAHHTIQIIDHEGKSYSQTALHRQDGPQADLSMSSKQSRKPVKLSSHWECLIRIHSCRGDLECSRTESHWQRTQQVRKQAPI